MARFCYYYLYKCYNCKQTFGSESQEAFMQTEEYKTLFEKDPKFNWCTCGCHLVTVTDWERIKRDRRGSDEEDIR
jgi:hypothetical protein